MEDEKSKVIAVYGMGYLDNIRYDALLKAADELGISVRSFDIENVVNYFSVLKEIFINWRPIYKINHKKETEELDRKFQEIKNEINEIQSKPREKQKVSVSLVDKLESLHQELLEIKQKIGLGIPIKKELSIEEKLRENLQVRKNEQN